MAEGKRGLSHVWSVGFVKINRLDNIHARLSLSLFSLSFEREEKTKNRETAKLSAQLANEPLQPFREVARQTDQPSRKLQTFFFPCFYLSFVSRRGEIRGARRNRAQFRLSPMV